MATEQATDQTKIVAGASGVLTFGVLASVTVMLFGNLPMGLVVGALDGVGTALLVQYFTTIEERGPADDAVARAFHSGAAGFALSGAGIVALAVLFVVERPVLAVAVGLAIGAVEYAVVSRALPRTAAD